MKTTLHTLLRSIAIVWLVAILAPYANADQKSFLWQITSKQNVVYVLGSVHVGNSALYPLNKTIEDAFTQSSVLAVEVDATDQQAMMATMHDDGALHAARQYQQSSAPGFNRAHAENPAQLQPAFGGGADDEALYGGDGINTV